MTYSISMSKSLNQPSMAALADGQNVNLFKYSPAILSFIANLSETPCLYAYDRWRFISAKKEQKLQNQHWQCIDVLGITKNELDQCLMNNFKNLCRFWRPDILVLIANDGDFAPMVRTHLEAGCQVIIIGYRDKVSKRLQRLATKNVYFVEELHRDFSIAE